MTEWLLPFLSGVGATIIGFILTMAWDNYKYSRDSKKRDETIVNAVKEEIETNLMVLSENQNMLHTEVKVLKDKKSLVTPLMLLHSGFWDLIKINIPNKLISVKMLEKVRNAGHFTNLINEDIRSRENYRIHNESMSNYHNRLMNYNHILLKDIENLIQQLQELKLILNSTEREK